MAKTELTNKQQRFCQEYMIDLNASQAALRAGYSPKCIHNQGPANLLKPIIQGEIQKLKAECSRRTEVTADKVVLELAKIAFSSIQDYMTVDEDGEAHLKDFEGIDAARLAAVESIKVNMTKNKDGDREYVTTQFKLHSKLNALEQLGKHLGIYQKDNEQKSLTIIDIMAIVGINGNGN